MLAKVEKYIPSPKFENIVQIETKMDSTTTIWNTKIKQNIQNPQIKPMAHKNNTGKYRKSQPNQFYNKTDHTH